MFKELDSIVIILTAIALAFVLALWISLIIWTYRDIRARSKDRLFRFLAILSVIVFNFPGLIIYLILRPKYTFTDYYQTALEEEALLQSIEGFGTCSSCGHQIKSNWKYCPYCENMLVSECANCGTLLKPEWVICPQCATPTAPATEMDAQPQFSVIENEDQREEDEELMDEMDNSLHPTDMILEEEEFDSFQED